MVQNLSIASAAQLLAALRDRRLSAEALMEATLSRIEAVNPSVNAIVAMRGADDLLAEARAKDKCEVSGPLHGLPYAVKDTVKVRGIVSTRGSPIFAGNVPETDDMLAKDLRNAGAIFIGKTNVPEFGIGSHTFNTVYGTTRNPYARSLSCGGSSGGAVVSLATGMTALADGSDIMGSLRNPAGWNNVYGFRPSWGDVLGDAVGDTFLHQIATIGPMARSPADLAILLDVMAHPDPHQPHGRPHSPISPLKPADLSSCRIGWLGDWGGAYPMEDGILAACESALAQMQTLGANVEPLSPPFSAERIWDSWTVLRSWLVGSGIDDLPDLSAGIKDSAEWELDRYRRLSAAEVHRAGVVCSEWFRTAADLFERYDALVLPTAQVWPFPVEIPWPTEIAGVAMDTYHRWMEVVVPVSLIGLPCLAVPAGFGQTGLPMGLQLFGPRGSDARLLAIGEAYHRATEWPQKFPAMAEV